MTKYRCRLEVLAEVLHYLKDGEKRPYRIMGSCGLSFAQMPEVENQMKSAGLIIVRADSVRGQWWKITAKGQDALADYEKTWAKLAVGASS